MGFCKGRYLVCLLMLLPLGCTAAEDPSPPQETIPAGQAVAWILDQEIFEEEAPYLDGIILGSLMEKYAAEQGIEPDESELQGYLDAEKRFQESTRKIWEQERDAALKALDAEDIPDTERADLENQVTLLEDLLREDPREIDPGQELAIRREIAHGMIKSWKVNQRLYEQYGGRVVFQQAGPEPLDAYRSFLEQHREAGSFSFSGPEVESSFWNYFTNDTLHMFFEPDQGRQAMHTPWWTAEQ